MIKIDHLTVKFGGVVALDDLSLIIDADVTGLIGPNGAGKTTLTNAFSGFINIHVGAILVDGLNLLDMAPHKRTRWGLARSFQKVQLVDELTVEDHLLTVREACGTARTRPINEVLDYVGIAERRTTYGRDLNPYQRRMAEIAKCLAGAPKIILLDEPGGGLSEAEMQHLRRLILGVKTEFGAQIILVDHDVSLIRDVCSVTAVLDFGKLIASGLTENVLIDEVVKAAYLGR